MRLVRQYRSDKGFLTGRLVLVTVFVGTMYALISVTVSVFANNYFDASFRRRDEALLAGINSDLDHKVSDRIAAREILLSQIHDKPTTARLRRQLAALYEREGNDLLRSGSRSSAEMCFRKASQLDPTNSAYYYDTAQLYADAAVEQHVPNSSVELYRNSVDLFSRALDREHDPFRRQKISDDAASASYDLAKVEFTAPAGKGQAVLDLQRAKEWVTPGTQTAADIEQLFLLATS